MLPDPRSLGSMLGDPLGLALQVDVATEPARPDDLSPPERRRFDALARTPRARSWLLGRAALRRVGAYAVEGGEGRGPRFPNPRYSLSHSGGTALAVAAPSGVLEGIGVDLEIGTRILPRAARFYLTPREQDWLSARPPAHRQRHLLRLWCIKEAVFKANPGNDGTILADHAIADPGACRGEARTRDARRLEYVSWSRPGACVALAVCR